MRHALPLHMMVPRASHDGMLLAERALSPSEVAQCIKEEMEPSRDDVGAVLDFMYPMPGHPPMWPKSGNIVFVSSLSLCLFFN